MSKRISTILGATLGVAAVVIALVYFVMFSPLGQPAATTRPTFVVLTTPGPSLTPVPTASPTPPVGDQPGTPPPSGSPLPSGGVGD